MLLGSHRYRARPYTRMFPVPGGRPCPHKSSDLTWPSQATQEHNLHFGPLLSMALESDLHHEWYTHRHFSIHATATLVCTAVFKRQSILARNTPIYAIMPDQQAMRLTDISREAESGLCGCLTGAEMVPGRPELSASHPA